jgi:hypothetical protein
VLSLLGSNGVILTITLLSSLLIPLPYCQEKRDNSIKKLYFLLQNIQKSLVIFVFHVTLCPNQETFTLHIIIALYCYRFGHMFTRYRYRKIGSIIASLSYCFWNIGTVIAIVSYFSGNIRIVINS